MPREADIQRKVMAAIGSEPDLLLFKNSVGRARYSDRDGREFYVPFGIMRSSPDLVGILRQLTKVGGDAATPRNLGQWFALELKTPGESATPEQKKCHEIWRGYGAFVAPNLRVASLTPQR